MAFEAPAAGDTLIEGALSQSVGVQYVLPIAPIKLFTSTVKREKPRTDRAAFHLISTTHPLIQSIQLLSSASFENKQQPRKENCRVSIQENSSKLIRTSSKSQSGRKACLNLISSVNLGNYIRQLHWSANISCLVAIRPFQSAFAVSGNK